MKINKIVYMRAFLLMPSLGMTGQSCNSNEKQLIEQGRAAGLKAITNVPLQPLPIYPLSQDFTLTGVNAMSEQEQEYFREGFTKGLSKVLGEHVGWKYGLAAATPAVPSLGYENPIVGELLKKMIIVGNNVDVCKYKTYW